MSRRKFKVTVTKHTVDVYEVWADSKQHAIERVDQEDILPVYTKGHSEGDCVVEEISPIKKDEG